MCNGKILEESKALLTANVVKDVEKYFGRMAFGTPLFEGHCLYLVQLQMAILSDPTLTPLGIYLIKVLVHVQKGIYSSIVISIDVSYCGWKTIINN